MNNQRTLHVQTIGGQIVEDKKTLCNPKFDYLSVWSDEERINIDLDNNDKEDNKYKDSWVNITMTVDDAELLVFLLQQKINEVRKIQEED